MGECYWHGGSNNCPECEKEQDIVRRENKYHERAKNMVPEHKYCLECESYYFKGKKHKCV